MLPLQLPLCVCGSDGHSHADAGRGEQQKSEGVPAEGHEHADQEAYSHAGHEHAGHSHDLHHSHSPAGLPASGHSGDDHSDASPAPASDGHHHDGSTPCECSPQQTPIGPLPKIESVDSPERFFEHWLTHWVAVTNSPGQTILTVQSHPPWAGTNPLATFQGNPCALFCRWVI